SPPTYGERMAQRVAERQGAGARFFGSAHAGHVRPTPPAPGSTSCLTSAPPAPMLWETPPMARSDLLLSLVQAGTRGDRPGFRRTHAHRARDGRVGSTLRGTYGHEARSPG